MSNQPIVFNVNYTPHHLKKNATLQEVTAHQEERSFYDMSGTKNIFEYITTEGKRVGKITALEYFEKSMGVFNQNGMLPLEEITLMKKRLKENQGNIWHGFISFSEEDSHHIDSPSKCIALIKSTINPFFKDAKLLSKNLDLMCALHLDKPKHLHIHFVFWEKEALYKKSNKELGYRSKGKIDSIALDHMFVRLGLYIDNKKEDIYQTRNEALSELKKMTTLNRTMISNEEIKDQIMDLTKKIPKTGRFSYGSENMKEHHKQIDNIVQLLLQYDKEARKSNLKFYQTLADKKRRIRNICGNHIASLKLPIYHNKIDENNLKIISDIEKDYKRRQGNLVLSLVKSIKPELYEKRTGKKYKANDNTLKRNLSMSNKKIHTLFKKFFTTIGYEQQLLQRDFTDRLHQIEMEIEREKEQEDFYKD